MINSTNNETIILYSKLKDKKYRDQEGIFIVEGKHLVEEAIKNNIVKVIFSTCDYPNSIKVSDKVMKKLSSLNTPPEVLAVCYKLKEKEIDGNILILDGIQDPGNLGTIIRTCVAFNVKNIVASLDTVDIYNPKVIRASEGMIFKINYLKRDLKTFISSLKDYQIYTTNVVNGININDIKLVSKYALIMGNEGNGVRSDIASYATKSIYIPMNKDCESLNVSIATSIILYEFNKQ